MFAQSIKKLRSYFNRIPSWMITVVFLIIIITIAVFLRFYQIGKLSFWNDEIASFELATHSLKELWPREMNMSLYYFIIHFWIQIFPNASEGTLRVISAIFSIASIPVVFMLGKIMDVDRKKSVAIGLVAALLLAINAYHIQYGQELRAYSLVFLLATLSTFLFIKAIERPNDSSHHWWKWYIIVSTAAMYSHFFMVFILMAQAISLLVLFRGDVLTFAIKLRIIGSYVAIAFLIFPLVDATFQAGTGGLAWISAPTFSSIIKFAVEIAGNRGYLLLVFYLLSVSVGLLTGVSAWFQKNIMTKWKLVLVANCLFLPIFMTLLVSIVMAPVFLDRYLLFVMPYMAVLASIGIVTLVKMGWNWKIGIATIPIGITLFVLIVLWSVNGVSAYFEQFQKENWRAVSQFIKEEGCEESLRLYYMTYMERNVVYYNANLKSQIKNWSGMLKKNPSSDELVDLFPKEYNQACLVLGHNFASQNRTQTKIIQTAIQTKYPKVMKNSFLQLIVEVYKK